MKNLWTKEVDQILSVGHQLKDIGLHNWALTKKQVLNVLEKLNSMQVAILGGDVCQNIEGVIKPNYDSWYCEQLPSEPKDIFIKRSIAKAKKYIEEYSIKQSDEIYFVLVPDV